MSDLISFAFYASVGWLLVMLPWTIWKLWRWERELREMDRQIDAALKMMATKRLTKTTPIQPYYHPLRKNGVHHE